MSLIGVVISFVFSAWLTWRFCDPASRFHILDHPNERSLHARPTPRSGGLAILAGIVLGLALAAWRFDQTGQLIWLSLSMSLVAAVSHIDDRHQVPVIGRLSVHWVAASVLLWGGFSFRIFDLPGFEFSMSNMLGGLLSLVFIVWMINLYNFMDGIDGFAGGMAVFGFGAFALMGWMAGHETFLVTNLIIVASSAGFLLFNFPPARIFMGDVGSSSLGLLAAFFSLWGARDGVFPLWIALLVFSPFIVDATVTLISRLLRRERFWVAHKTHYYQQLVQAGWGHRKTVLFEYSIMIACCITALWCIRASFVIQLAVLVFWGLFYSLFLFYVSRRSVQHKKTGIL